MCFRTISGEKGFALKIQDDVANHSMQKSWQLSFFLHDESSPFICSNINFGIFGSFHKTSASFLQDNIQ
ncbi:hypothetical protein GN956_G22631 [Arapaima gigas]